MAYLYTLKIVTDFAAAHTLKNYPGNCSQMHGHNWKVEVEVTATELDEVGMGLDFKIIKRKTKEVIKNLDHRYLNDLAAFELSNPTAENIAAYLFEQISATIDTPSVAVKAVTLWETERACVRCEKL